MLGQPCQFRFLAFHVASQLVRRLHACRSAAQGQLQFTFGRVPNLQHSIASGRNDSLSRRIDRDCNDRSAMIDRTNQLRTRDIDLLQTTSFGRDQQRFHFTTGPRDCVSIGNRRDRLDRDRFPFRSFAFDQTQQVQVSKRFEQRDLLQVRVRGDCDRRFRSFRFDNDRSGGRIPQDHASAGIDAEQTPRDCRVVTRDFAIASDGDCKANDRLGMPDQTHSDFGGAGARNMDRLVGSRNREHRSIGCDGGGRGR